MIPMAGAQLILLTNPTAAMTVIIRRQSSLGESCCSLCSCSGGARGIEVLNNNLANKMNNE